MLTIMSQFLEFRLLRAPPAVAPGTPAETKRTSHAWLKPGGPCSRAAPVSRRVGEAPRVRHRVEVLLNAPDAWLGMECDARNAVRLRRESVRRLRLNHARPPMPALVLVSRKIALCGAQPRAPQR